LISQPLRAMAKPNLFFPLKSFARDSGTPFRALPEIPQASIPLGVWGDRAVLQEETERTESTIPVCAGSPSAAEAQPNPWFRSDFKEGNEGPGR
jgi:hypothetical protein